MYLDSFHASAQASCILIFPLETYLKESKALNCINAPSWCVRVNTLLGNTMSGICGNSNALLYLKY